EAHRMNIRSNSAGRRLLNTRLIVSWEGIPPERRRNLRRNFSLVLPKVSIDSQDSAPQSTATMERMMISTKICFLLREMRHSWKDSKYLCRLVLMASFIKQR